MNVLIQILYSGAYVLGVSLVLCCLSFMAVFRQQHTELLSFESISIELVLVGEQDHHGA